jgi:hypothetical protein
MPHFSEPLITNVAARKQVYFNQRFTRMCHKYWHVINSHGKAALAEITFVMREWNTFHSHSSPLDQVTICYLAVNQLSKTEFKQLIRLL